MCSATLPTGRRRCTATCGRRPPRGRGSGGSQGCGTSRGSASSGPSTARGAPRRVRAGGEARGARRGDGAAHHGVLGRRGPAVRLADRGDAAGHAHARVLDVDLHRGAGGRGDHLGRDVLGDDLPPQARGRVGRAAAPDAVQPARRDRLHGRPDDHRGGALRLHGAGAEQRHRRQDPDAGPQGGHRRVPVELAVHLPRHAARRRAPRSPRSARPTRSRCWCCRRTSRSSSPSAATT